MRNDDTTLEQIEMRVAERTMHLEQKVARLQTFSYAVAHDLRAPLRSIQGYSQVLLDRYKGGLDEAGISYLGRIKNSAEWLDALIKGLLVYTKVSNESSPLAPVSLESLVGQILAQYPNFQSPQAEIPLSKPLLPVICSESALTVSLVNLLENATKFVTDGVTPRILLYTEQRGDRVRIWLEDNGIGIEPENHHRIFNLFVQLHDPHLYGGTGIGLAIVKCAMDGLGGTVGLESVPGQGSKFWIELDGC